MTEQARQTDVQALLDAHPFGAYQWLVFALCFLIVLLDGFDTAAIGYIAPSLMSEWGIAKADLAPVLSAALFGMAVGALLIGPLSDRFGRKRLLLVAVAVMGTACLGSAFSTDVQMLTWLRFVTGLGLGAAMPNAVTLVSEYAPGRRRALLTSAMFCGFPLGLSLGGFLAAWMIPGFGWRSVLILGGVAPLALLLVLIVVLPESIRYMVVRQWPRDRIRRVLARMLGDAAVPQGSRYVLPEHGVAGEAAQGPQGLTLVFAPRYRLGTLMLYLTYFMGLVVVYALMNWMPVLFREAGIEASTAARIAALFPLGGIGVLFFGWLMDRYEPNKVIAFGYLGTAVSIWLIGLSVGQVGWLVLLVFLAGIMINTAQAAMPALGAMFYPTAGRATGVAWMLGIGRFGGIAGSFLVGALTARDLDLRTIFSVVAVPGLIAAVALYVKAWASARQAEKA